MSAIAYLFPGQGSQTVGMGQALAQQFSVARDTFQEADEVLGFGLAQLCFEGPAATLTETQNAQPAILTASLAALRALHAARPDLPPVSFFEFWPSWLFYTPVVAHLAGELGLRAMRDLVAQGHRNNVKRQTTWLRREPGQVVDARRPEACMSEVEAFLGSGGEG